MYCQHPCFCMRNEGQWLSLGPWWVSGKAISHKHPSLCGNNTSHLEVPLSTGLKAICKQNRMHLITAPHPASHPAVTDGLGGGGQRTLV